jgi:hypothetical protein
MRPLLTWLYVCLLLLQAPACWDALWQLASNTNQLVYALPDVACPQHGVLNGLMLVAPLHPAGLRNGCTIIAQMAQQVRGERGEGCGRV